MKKRLNKEKKKNEVKFSGSYLKKLKSRLMSEQNNFNFFEVLVLIVVSIFFGIVVGFFLNFKRNSLSSAESSSELLDVYNTILNTYDGDLNEKDLMNAAISGMVNSLGDEYSVYMNADETKDFNLNVDGSYFGIGATVATGDDGNYVYDLFDNAPAKNAGMKIGDIIVSVNGADVTGYDLEELTALFLVDEGTKLNIQVLRGDKTIDISLVVSKVEIPVVFSKVIELENQKVGYINISSFSSISYNQFKAHLDSLEKEKIDFLIIDVRDNLGGHLSQVEKILSLFFNKKTVLYQIQEKDKVKKVYSSGNRNAKYKVAILTNSSSASASEILAACFKENCSECFTVGTDTFGKGSVQQEFSLSSGSSFKFTTQKWLTPSGNWINGKGVKADYFVEQSENYYADPKDDNDAQLKRALDIICEKKKN